jgi:hypothetical protein
MRSRSRTWIGLVIWGLVPYAAVLVLYRADFVLDRIGAAARGLAALAAFALIARTARQISVLQARDLDARERVRGGPLRRRATLAAPRRWALWLTTNAVAVGAGYLTLATDADHTSDLISVGPLDVAVLLVGAAIIAPYLFDLAAGVTTRREPFGSRGTTRTFVEEPNVMGAISRMSPTLVFFITLAAAEWLATWLAGVHDARKLVGGLGFVAMTAAGVLTAPTIITSFGDFESRWRSDWYVLQLRIAEYLRRATLATRALLRVLQVVTLGGVTGAPSTLSSKQVGALSLTFVLAVLTAHGLTRILWLWAPTCPDTEPIGATALKEHEQSMLRVAAIALAFGSVASLAAILI